ncbi:MAG: UTRA domain-containing protein [Pseudomonadales bacterium]|uniref:UTRA domain-containing protein n=1 Tax=Marinobacter xestospongiae TaxID=994319 RepID=UPI00200479E1|nr:UTRA domain-containing protein [Marinobacter xestospongiae]MCG8520005.1 UTRA domain-containing protein [Pseudomonadales bacterium]MCK7565139.1 UTRA domain-containing protein [Marinobacter xestospongiae]
MEARANGEGSTPLYLRVRDQLANQIEAGLLAANTRLPSERVLAESHGTTRVTTRLALAQLEAEGRIYRSNRRGWFVSPPRLVYNPTQDYSFSDNVTSQGRTPATETLEVTTTEVAPWLANKTGLAVGDAIVRLRRRRQVDGRPVLVENIYLNPKRLPGIEQYDFNRSLWKLLREKFSVELQGKRIEMFPTALVDPQAEALGVNAGTAGLYVTRRSHDADGVFVEFDEEFWLHDTLSIQVEVQ